MLQKIIVLSILAIVFSIPTTVYACRCKMPATSWAYKKAEMIVVVKAEMVENLSEERQTVELSVSDAWKQNAPASLKILAGGKVCGYFFEAGKDYVVYLKKNENGEWTTANCVGNKVVNDKQFPLFTRLARQDRAWLKRNGKKSLIE